MVGGALLSVVPLLPSNNLQHYISRSEGITVLAPSTNQKQAQFSGYSNALGPESLSSDTEESINEKWYLSENVPPNADLFILTSEDITVQIQSLHLEDHPLCPPFTGKEDTGSFKLPLQLVINQGGSLKQCPNRKVVCHLMSTSNKEIDKIVCFVSNWRVTKRMSPLLEQKYRRCCDRCRMNKARNEHALYRQLQITVSPKQLRLPTYAVEKLCDSDSFSHHQFVQSNLVSMCHQSSASSTNSYIKESSCLTSYSTPVFHPHICNDVGDTTELVRAIIV